MKPKQATYRGGPSATYSDSDYEALLESHRRLRAAAQSVLAAADYPDDDGEARIYRSQLATLKRELDGVPQPSALFFMSVS